MIAALESARSISVATPDKEGPLLEFIDWSNPDPQAESYDGAVALSSAARSSIPKQIVWKISGVSSLDVAGNGGKRTALVYSSSTELEHPALDIPGLLWRAAAKNTLLGEVADRVITRSEVNRWFDAAWISFAVYATGFGYAFTRYSQYVNGSYPDTMIPLYIADKAFGWTALWMMSSAPFAGNLLTIIDSFTSTSAYGIDKFNSVVCAVIMVLPVFLFAIPWIVWAIVRMVFTDWEKKTSIRSTLVDMVSLKTETGVACFFFLMSHALMGITVLVPYKTKFFNPDNKGRLYGNYELSLTSGILAFTLVTMLTIRSLIKEGSWMKQKPLYNYVSPLAILLGTLHLIFQGYQGWAKSVFAADHNGQPSPSFTASMFSIGVLVAHAFLVVLGTKKRVRQGVHMMKHSAVEDAFAKYSKVRGQVVNGPEMHLADA